MTFFPEDAPSANPVFFRTYSRSTDGQRESFDDVNDRTVNGVAELGKLNEGEIELISQMQKQQKTFTSGRWLWVGGTDWVKQPENFSGSYNCTSSDVDDWRSFGLLMNLAMCGTGTGAVLEPRCIEQLPIIRNQLNVTIVEEIGEVPSDERDSETSVYMHGNNVTIVVGDSRQGWVDSYQHLIELSSAERFDGQPVNVSVLLGNVRPAGEKLKGFGGVSNPAKLTELYGRCAAILNRAIGRQLNSLECCLLIDEAALTIVAGNIRRCLPGDAMVLTEHGEVAISDIQVGDRVVTPIGLKPVTAKFDQGIQDVYEIVTNSSYPRATLNHRIATLTKSGNVEWVLVTNLRRGDSLVPFQRDISVQVERLGKVFSFPTFDIEVADAHCFYADGYLTHNSAGIRQFASDDPLGETAKDNLWQQGEDGRWRIDPDRDALRMANHTRVYHTIPPLEAIVASVTKQFYSGEGAIQYAPEAIARASADLLRNRGDKEAFIRSYLKSPDEAKNLFLMMGVPEEEADDRLHRYGLNPCLAKGTMVRTLYGHYPIEELIGRTVLVWDNEEWVSVDNFRVTGTNQPIVKVIFSDGTFVRATPNHKFFLKNGESIEAKDLLPEMELLTDSTYPNQKMFVRETIADGIDDEVYCCTVPNTHRFALTNGIVSGNCGEIIMRNNSCNLSEVHLNRLNPNDRDEQEKAFKAAAIWVSALLHHEFVEPRYQRSRELDPIVGVSFTGLFDFFVEAFGVDWLRWWQAGRSDDWNEASEEGGRLIKQMAKTTLSWYEYSSEVKHGAIYKHLERRCLRWWRSIVEETVAEYCDRHGLKRPNRCTTCQPAGCLTRDAVRVFDQGLLYADEHMTESQGEVDLSYFGLTVRGGVKVNKGIANDLMPLIKITLDSGRWVKATFNHRFSVNGEWVAAEDIKPGMAIDFSFGEYSKKEEAKLVPQEYSYSGVGRPPNKSLIPDQMSPELAYWIGAMYGNGSTEPVKSRVVFTHGITTVLDKLSEIGTNLFGIVPARKAGSRDGNFEHLVFSSSHLYEWLQKNGLLKTEKSIHISRIPFAIRASSRNSVLAFIAGIIDTDGCISTRGDVEIYSASEDFLRNLQQISEAIGLCWTLSSRVQKGSWDGSDIWRLHLRKSFSLPCSINTLNSLSVKASSNPITLSVKRSSANPFNVSSAEWIFNESDYTYDYGVEGVNDDDSWYWQGAIKSHNTKSLLTGASPGWSPPKAAWFIRRITFGKSDPVALACIDYGYTVIPSQSDKDEDGRLLDDPFDPRCTEWLVEIPTAVSWADIPGVEEIDISQFSALAQFDFYMQVQGHYVGHNASATIELRAAEIEPLAEAIHTAIVKNQGYISATLLARFDDLQTFPRLPFEPITKTEYNVLHEAVLKRRINPDFQAALAKYDRGENIAPAGCDSDKCLFPLSK